jgi:hypothetical protein
MTSRLSGDGTVSVERSAFRPHVELTLAEQRQAMKETMHMKCDKKLTRGKKHEGQRWRR